MAWSHTANLVRDARTELQLSQADLGTAVGYSNGQFVSNIERGKAFIPPAKVGAFATMLKKPVDKFIEAYAKDCEVDYRARVDSEAS